MFGHGALNRGTQKGSTVDWANESLAITRAADTKYCDLDSKDECCYPGVKSGCKHKGKKNQITLTTQYDDDHVAIVGERLKKAGVRLAAILEDVLKQHPNDL